MAAVEVLYKDRIGWYAYIETADAHVGTVEKKIPMIVVSDAIVHPRFNVGLYRVKVVNVTRSKFRLIPKIGGSARVALSGKNNN